MIIKYIFRRRNRNYRFKSVDINFNIRFEKYLLPSLGQPIYHFINRHHKTGTLAAESYIFYINSKGRVKHSSLKRKQKLKKVEKYC